MNVIDALHSRHSVRAFRPEPVDKETLLKIMEAANRSPSWGDTQPWEIFVAGGEPLERLRVAFVDRFEKRVPGHPELPRPHSWPADLQRRMDENAAHRFAVMGIGRDDEQARRANSRRGYQFFGAPAVAYLCVNRTVSTWSVFDMGMLAQSIMLEALDLDLDSIPAVMLVTYPDLIRAELAIPDELLILIGIALGYADESSIVNKPRSLRRPVGDVVRFVGL